MFVDDEKASARIRRHRTRSSLWVAATTLAACLVTTLVLVNTASATETATLSQVVTPQLLLQAPTADSRAIFSAIIVVFSIAAAGLWRLSFRSSSRAQQDRLHEQK
jgi:hypothetical protein